MPGPLIQDEAGKTLPWHDALMEKASLVFRFPRACLGRTVPGGPVMAVVANFGTNFRRPRSRDEREFVLGVIAGCPRLLPVVPVCRHRISPLATEKAPRPDADKAARAADWDVPPDLVGPVPTPTK